MDPRLRGDDVESECVNLVFIVYEPSNCCVIQGLEGEGLVSWKLLKNSRSN
jgi:hypothetical protein